MVRTQLLLGHCTTSKETLLFFETNIVTPASSAFLRSLGATVKEVQLQVGFHESETA